MEVSDKDIIRTILARQKINYIKKVLNKEFVKIILNDDFRVNSKKPNENVFILSDLLEYLGIGDVVINSNKKGSYPVISNTKTNNGIVTKTNTYKFNEPILFTISRVSYVCFIQHGKINTTKDIWVFKPTMKINEKILQDIINIELMKIKSSSNASLANVKNMKLELPIEAFLDNEHKKITQYDYIKHSIDNIYDDLELSFEEYYKNHSISNVDMINFSDIFKIINTSDSKNIIAKLMFNFSNNTFGISKPGSAINKNSLYFITEIEYINYEKTIYLMNEFIKFIDNVSIDSIKNMKFPIYFEAAVE